MWDPAWLASLLAMVMGAVMWAMMRHDPRNQRAAFLASDPLRAVGPDRLVFAVPGRWPGGGLCYQRVSLSSRGLTYDIVGAEITEDDLVGAPAQGSQTHWTFDELEANPVENLGYELRLVKQNGTRQGLVSIGPLGLAPAAMITRAITDAVAARVASALPKAEALAQRAKLGQIHASVREPDP